MSPRPVKAEPPAEDAPNAPAPDTEQPPAEEPARVHGFTVGANEYTFPAYVPPGWGLTYLRLFYGSSENQALVWALNQLLGYRQLLALEGDPHLDRDALAAVVDACKKALIGAFEGPKGPSPSA